MRFGLCGKWGITISVFLGSFSIIPNYRKYIDMSICNSKKIFKIFQPNNSYDKTCLAFFLISLQSLSQKIQCSIATHLERNETKDKTLLK